MVRIFKSFFLALSLIIMTGAAAQAQVTVQGAPVERGIGFQEPATPIMERAVAQYNVLILPIVTAVTLFVLALLLWTCWKYREREGRQPSTVTHTTHPMGPHEPHGPACPMKPHTSPTWDPTRRDPTAWVTWQTTMSLASRGPRQ